MKTLRLLIAIIGILTMAGSAQGAENRRRRIMQNPNDPYLAFVPGKPLLFAAERGRSVLYLRYPELEVDRTLETPADRKLDVIKASPDGTWIAGFFEESSFRVGGTLLVWKLTTGETRLLMDDASRAFEFMDENRLIVWQPKTGITQWELSGSEGKRVGPVIANVSVTVNVSTKGMYLSPDGRYLLINGSCRDPESSSKWDSYSYCVIDLHDGSTVGWAEDPETSHDATGKFTRQFTELLVGTDIDPSGREQYGCRKAGQSRELCVDAVGVTLIEVAASAEREPPPPPVSAPAPKEDPAPAPTPRSGNRFSGIVSGIKDAVKAQAQAFSADLDAAREQRAARDRTRRALWTIRPTAEMGGHIINSGALSGDGRWVAVASMGVLVSLFDTEHLESQENRLNGEWPEPVMVKQFEMP